MPRPVFAAAGLLAIAHSAHAHPGHGPSGLLHGLAHPFGDAYYLLALAALAVLLAVLVAALAVARALKRRAASGTSAPGLRPSAPTPAGPPPTD